MIYFSSFKPPSSGTLVKATLGNSDRSHSGDTSQVTQTVATWESGAREKAEAGDFMACHLEPRLEALGEPCVFRGCRPGAPIKEKAGSPGREERDGGSKGRGMHLAAAQI